VREGEMRSRRREGGVGRCIEFEFGWGRWVLGVLGVGGWRERIEGRGVRR